MYTLKRIFNPEIFQGKYKRNNYFEGWYYKIIDKSSENILAVIPGVAVSRHSEHSFIQFIDAKTGFTRYLTFPKQAFTYSEKELNVEIEGNHFNKQQMSLNLKDNDFSISGDIEFNDIVSFPKTLLNPGIMGPYSFVPFMECHHGIINIHSGLRGGLLFNGQSIDFTGGYGYVEKDWGKSFPHSWIWLQSNNFCHRDTSLMFSIASIPWFRHEFDGLIAFLRINGSFLRFATYTGAKIKDLTVNDSILRVSIEDSEHILKLEASYGKGGILKAPKKGIMEVEITESITSTVKVELAEKPGRLIFRDVGENTGLELAGNYRKFATD